MKVRANVAKEHTATFMTELFKCISGQRISFILPIPSGRLRPGGVVVPVTITPLSIPAMAYLSSVNETKIDSNFISAAHNLWYSYSCALVWLQHLQSWWAMNNSVLWPLKDIGTIYVMFMRHDSWSWIRVAIFSSPLCPSRRSLGHVLITTIQQIGGGHINWMTSSDFPISSSRYGIFK